MYIKLCFLLESCPLVTTRKTISLANTIKMQPARNRDMHTEPDSRNTCCGTFQNVLWTLTTFFYWAQTLILLTSMSGSLLKGIDNYCERFLMLFINTPFIRAIKVILRLYSSWKYVDEAKMQILRSCNVFIWYSWHFQTGVFGEYSTVGELFRVGCSCNLNIISFS